MNDMKQFKIQYIPGGMSLSHSAWWLCEIVVHRDGVVRSHPIKFLRKADYN